MPAKGDAISEPFSPAKLGRLWDPQNAEKNHTARNIRFAETYSNARWTSGAADSFELEGSLAFRNIGVIRHFWAKKIFKRTAIIAQNKLENLV